MEKTRPMNERQKRFCDEYLIDCNGSRAYKAVYHHIKNDEIARANASRLLANANIKNYIDEELEKMHSAKVANAQEVLEYLTGVLRGESIGEVVVIEGTGDGCSEARRMTKLPDEKERLKAAELLGKRYGIYTDKVEIEGAKVVQIIDDIPKDAGDG